MAARTRRIAIPLRELRFQYARSSGAGGQNVNKVETKATLRWAVAESTALPAAVRARFLARHARRITRDGELVLSSQRFRDRGRNVADCIEKLHALLDEVAVAPRKRRPTKPTRAAKERRLEHKRRRSSLKAARRRPGDES